MYLFILWLILKVVGHRCTGIFSVSLIGWTHSLGLNTYYSEFLWKLLIQTNFPTQHIREHMIKLSCGQLMIQKFSNVFHFTPFCFLYKQVQFVAHWAALCSFCMPILALTSYSLFLLSPDSLFHPYLPILNLILFVLLINPSHNPSHSILVNHFDWLDQYEEVGLHNKAFLLWAHCLSTNSTNSKRLRNHILSKCSYRTEEGKACHMLLTFDVS